MRTRLTFLALIIVLLCGCLPRDQLSYGNQVGDTGPTAMNATLVNDTVAQIMASYPPTTNAFYLLQDQDGPDAFGQDLVAALKRQGYQVLSANDGAGAQALPGLPLAYIVDVPPDLDLYRVTVFVGPESISRAYVPTAIGAVEPVGPWSRRQ